MGKAIHLKDSWVSAAPFGLEVFSGITPPEYGVALNQSSANLALPGFSTTYGNDVIVVAILTNGTFTTVTGTSGITYARVSGFTPPSQVTTIDLWYGIAPSTPLSGEVITINNTGAYTTALAFAISGAKTSAPFDAAPTTTNSASSIPNATITTTATEAFGFGFSASSNLNLGTGFANMNTTARTGVLNLNWKLRSGSIFSSEVFDTASTNISIATAIVKGP